MARSQKDRGSIQPAMQAPLSRNTARADKARPSRWWLLSLGVQSLVYIAAGINHFRHESFYVHIMPDHYSDPATLVQLSGVAEILGGVGLLVPATRRASAAGIAVMLVVFLDVHQSMIRHPERFPGIPQWVLWARIPLQFALIGWAALYMQRPSAHAPKQVSEV